jgi:hypothetical protein
MSDDMGRDTTGGALALRTTAPKTIDLEDPMRTIKLFHCAAVLAVGVALSGVSRADNCSGVDVLVVQSAETLEVAKGHTLTVLRLYSIVTSDNPASPVNLTTGECSGTILSTPDGTTRGSGHCARKDKNGDTYSLEWTLPVGEQKGTWKHVAGTGKFTGTSDHGWWQGAVADGKMNVNRWGGTCR